MELGPSDYIKVMPERFLADKAGDMRAVIVFDLSGEDGGTWTVRIGGGHCSVARGADPAADSTIVMSTEDFVGVCTGRVRAMVAFLSGRIRIRGDINKVMRLRGTFK